MQSENSDQRVAEGERAQQRKQWDMGQSDSHAEACRSLQKPAEVGRGKEWIQRISPVNGLRTDLRPLTSTYRVISLIFFFFLSHCVRKKLL